MSIMCEDTDDRDTDADSQTPPAPDQATLDFAWAIASASDRDEWATDLEPLSPLSLRFDELREYARSIEWQGSEVYVYASKPRGEDPHPRREIDVDIWLTFDPLPETHVRATVIR